MQDAGAMVHGTWPCEVVIYLAIHNMPTLRVEHGTHQLHGGEAALVASDRETNFVNF